MKKFKSVIMIIVMLICVYTVSFAHGGNITGWKDKESKHITEYNGNYYGYHKENGVTHFHQLKWNEEKQKWEIVAPAIYYDENFNELENNYEINSNKIKVELVETVDGDTAKFKMNGEQVTVRFLGINTKETVDPKRGEETYGKEASNFTKEKLEKATKIELEFDSNADEKDKYDRYLAWIWIDDVLLQDLLVESGLAETYMLQNNYKYAGMLQKSEEIAKNNKLGIWSNETSNIQNNKNENQIIENNKIYIEGKNLIYIIISITIILIINTFSIAHNKKKRK